MSSNSSPKLLKFLDEQVLKQYTKLGKKLHLDKGKRKYKVGLGLFLLATMSSSQASKTFGGIALHVGSYVLIRCNDFLYSVKGVLDNIPDSVSDTDAIDPILYFHKKYNSAIRLPVLIGGVGLVGKFGVELFNNVVHGAPMDSLSPFYLNYGLSLIFSASSMYIKEMDPKLLEKESLRKKIKNWAKDKVNSLLPQPTPQPVPIRTYTTIDNYVQV